MPFTIFNPIDPTSPISQSTDPIELQKVISTNWVEALITKLNNKIQGISVDVPEALKKIIDDNLKEILDTEPDYKLIALDNPKQQEQIGKLFELAKILDRFPSYEQFKVLDEIFRRQLYIEDYANLPITLGKLIENLITRKMPQVENTTYTYLQQINYFLQSYLFSVLKSDQLEKFINSDDPASKQEIKKFYEKEINDLIMKLRLDRFQGVQVEKMVLENVSKLLLKLNVQTLEDHLSYLKKIQQEPVLRFTVDEYVMPGELILTNVKFIGVQNALDTITIVVSRNDRSVRVIIGYVPGLNLENIPTYIAHQFGEDAIDISILVGSRLKEEQKKYALEKISSVFNNMPNKIRINEPITSENLSSQATINSDDEHIFDFVKPKIDSIEKILEYTLRKKASEQLLQAFEKLDIKDYDIQKLEMNYVDLFNISSIEDKIQSLKLTIIEQIELYNEVRGDYDLNIEIQDLSVFIVKNVRDAIKNDTVINNQEGIISLMNLYSTRFNTGYFKEEAEMRNEILLLLTEYFKKNINEVRKYTTQILVLYNYIIKYPAKTNIILEQQKDFIKNIIESISKLDEDIIKSNLDTIIIIARVISDNKDLNPNDIAMLNDKIVSIFNKDIEVITYPMYDKNDNLISEGYISIKNNDGSTTYIKLRKEEQRFLAHLGNTNPSLKTKLSLIDAVTANNKLIVSLSEQDKKLLNIQIQQNLENQHQNNFNMFDNFKDIISERIKLMYPNIDNYLDSPDISLLLSSMKHFDDGITSLKIDFNGTIKEIRIPTIEIHDYLPHIYNVRGI